MLLMIFGFLVRLGLPVGITTLLVMWLRRLDFRWQKESASEKALPFAEQPHNTGCWVCNGCSPEKIATCKAYAHPEAPCWQVFRDENGRLRESCLVCSVFRNAPLPATSGH
jgi:hypothetical protein